MLVSTLSAFTALMRIMGILANNSFGRLSSMDWVFSSQRAPSIISPLTYAPSLLMDVTLDGSWKRVISVVFIVLSKAHCLSRAVVCITAVRNDWGENSPPSQVTLGNPSSPVQVSSCFWRSRRFPSHDDNPRFEGYAMASHFPGTLLSARAFISVSIESVICKSPLRPKSISLRDRRISPMRKIIRSISCKNTFTYGVRSSTRSVISLRTN
mmetsp:Transcript_88795/g.236360  ORF Transcript_88795/g.236360 Transcript_88795/m.236360 type:complete len:211 (+) Transcript_88795:387-1019(+)